MKRVIANCCAIICLVLPVMGQKMQPLPTTLQSLQAENIFPAKAETGYAFSDKSGGSKPATFSASIQNDAPFFTAEIFSAAPSHFNIQSSWRNITPVKKGDVLLARITVRAVYAKQESGDAVLNFFVQQAVAPFERNVLIEMRIGPEWKTFDIPFVSLLDMPTGDASIGFTYGALAQKVEITGIQVLSFQQKATLAQMPATKFSYNGREKDAGWRKAALKRIEEIRTAPLVIQVKDDKGKPVKGAIVKARLIDPEFIFGSALTVNYVTSEDSNGVIYRRLFRELFNAGTIDNALKWGGWRDLQTRDKAKKTIDWMMENNIRLRGHNLVWPGKKFTPAFFSRQPQFGPSFADSITAHIEDIATYTKGKVYGWDVINEMMHEKDYFEVMPRTKAVEWFKQAKRIDPGATLFINEYSMLNNIASPQNIKNYLAIIAELRNGGAPIDAIGVQGHVGRQPRSPVEVISDLDMFTSTGLPVQITEFDINSPDEDLQADYTRDFLIACYSHPVVNGFTMWGFWESAHWKPDAAMYRKDWTPKPNATVWRDLVLKEWRTNISATSKANGEVSDHGHLGKYEVTVTKGNKVTKQFYQLTKDAKPVVIKL